MEPPELFDAVDVRLYNLEEDETESTNIASQFPDVVERMTNRIQDVWLNEKEGYKRPQLNFPHRLANPRLHKWEWRPFL